MSPNTLQMNSPVQNQTPANPSPAGSTGLRVKVLAVDDNDEFRTLLKDLLTPLGFDVILAANPVKALEVFQREMANIELVLLDYYMPQMDGTKTFEWLRKFNPNIKVIVCSGADELRLRQIQVQHKIDGYLRKPFRSMEAVAYIKRVLAQPVRV